MFISTRPFAFRHGAAARSCSVASSSCAVQNHDARGHGMQTDRPVRHKGTVGIETTLTTLVNNEPQRGCCCRWGSVDFLCASLMVWSSEGAKTAWAASSPSCVLLARAAGGRAGRGGRGRELGSRSPDTDPFRRLPQPPATPPMRVRTWCSWRIPVWYLSVDRRLPLRRSRNQLGQPSHRYSFRSSRVGLHLHPA